MVNTKGHPVVREGVISSPRLVPADARRKQGADGVESRFLNLRIRLHKTASR